MFGQSNRTDVRQSDLSVEGDVAAGNINKNVIQNFAPATRHSSAIPNYLERYRSDLKSGCKEEGFVTALKRFLTHSDDGELVGLEGKLEKAGWSKPHIKRAMRLKESFAMHMNAHQFSPAAQEFFSYLLSEVESRFYNYVAPLIEMNVPILQVKREVYEKVVDPIVSEAANNDINIDHSYVEGMIFFLTGYCHVDWTW